MIDAIVSAIDRLIQLLEYRNQKRERLFDEIVEPTFALLETVHRDYLGMFEDTAARLSRLIEKRLEWIKKAGLPPIYLDNEEPFSDWTDERSRIDPTSPAYQAAVELGFIEPIVDCSGMDDLVEMRNIAQFLQERRREFEPVRVKLRRLIATARIVSLPENIEKFVDAVADYLPVAAPREARPSLNQFQHWQQRAGPDDRFGAVTVTASMLVDQRLRDEVERLSHRRYEKSLDVWGEIWATDVPNRWADIHQELMQILRHHREHWRRVSAAYSALQFELKLDLSVPNQLESSPTNPAPSLGRPTSSSNGEG